MLFSTAFGEMTDEKHFHCVSKYRRSSCTQTSAFLPQSLLKLRGNVVCQALSSTIPSAPTSGLLLGPQTFGYGMALTFFRVRPQITKGLERRKKPKLWAGMSRRWGLYPGRCYVGAEQGLQDWASWTWVPFGNQPTGTWTGDNCHVSTDGAICPYVQLGLEAGLC